MNAGFYLYGANAMQYSADIGVATIAAEGNYDNPLAAAPNNADAVAISRMITVGLDSTPLVTVTEIDIWKENVSGTGVFSDDTSDPLCSGGGGACENIYNGQGVLQNPVAGKAPWPASVREVDSTPDYAKLVIHFKYTLLIGTTTFSSTTFNLFRLEPQT
jgi:hypothetical protein